MGSIQTGAVGCWGQGPWVPSWERWGSRQSSCGSRSSSTAQALTMSPWGQMTASHPSRCPVPRSMMPQGVYRTPPPPGLGALGPMTRSHLASPLGLTSHTLSPLGANSRYPWELGLEGTAGHGRALSHLTDGVTRGGSRGPWSQGVAGECQASVTDRSCCLGLGGRGGGDPPFQLTPPRPCPAASRAATVPTPPGRPTPLPTLEQQPRGHVGRAAR